MVSSSLYWDANAASKMRPSARSIICEWYSEDHCADFPYNPSSIHTSGRIARGLLRKAREQVSSFLFSDQSFPHELIFCSGGTEACNTIVKAFLPPSLLGKEIIISAVEHPAVRDCANSLVSSGAKIVEFKPGLNGIFCSEDLVSLFCPETEVVSLMLANNETGIGVDVRGCALALRKAGYQGAIVSDITQALGKTLFSLDELFIAGVDAVAFSAHKIGALAGLGGVVLNTASSCRSFKPLLQGGPQENRFRPGTESVIAALSLGAVCIELNSTQEIELERRSRCTNLLRSLLAERFSNIRFISFAPGEGPPYSLPNTVYLSIPGIRGDDAVVALDLAGLYCSVGSACGSGKQEVSHVPLALGLSEEDAASCLRLSLDWDITEAEIREGADRFIATISRMNEHAPVLQIDNSILRTSVS